MPKIVWQSLQLYFCQTRFPSTTSAVSFSSFVRLGNSLRESELTYRNPTDKMTVPAIKTFLAVVCVMRASLRWVGKEGWGSAPMKQRFCLIYQKIREMVPGGYVPGLPQQFQQLFLVKSGDAHELV